MPLLRDDRFDERRMLEQLAKERAHGKVIPMLMQGLTSFVSNPDAVSVYTYQRMIETDETVGAAVDLLILSVVGRLGEYIHPSDEVTDLVRAAFRAMRGSLRSVAAEMMTAKWAGFSVSEINYALGTLDGRTVAGWESVRTLPPATMAFEVDAIGDVTEDGIVQFEKPFRQSSGWLLDNLRVVPDNLAGLGNRPWPTRVGMLLGNHIRIPREKCVHFVSGSPIFGNPYGRSPLRRAYKSWLMKDVILRMLLTALDRKGTPLTVGRAPARDVAIYGPNGERLQDTTGADRQASAQWLLMQALANLHQDSALVIGPKDDGYDIESLDYGTAGSEFVEALNYLNRAIVRSLLLPSLILEEGLRSGSLALGRAHADTFATVIDSELETLQTILIDQLVRRLIVLNFGELDEGYGEFSPVALDPEEQRILTEVFETLVDKGFLDADDAHDWQYVRGKLDIPADQEIFDRQERAREEEDLGAEPAPEPQPNPGETGDRRRMGAAVIRLFPQLRAAA